MFVKAGLRGSLRKGGGLDVFLSPSLSIGAYETEKVEMERIRISGSTG